MVAALAGEGVAVDRVDGSIEQTRAADAGFPLAIERHYYGTTDVWEASTRDGTLRLKVSFRNAGLDELTRWDKSGIHKQFEITRVRDAHSWARWRADGTALWRAQFSLRGYLDSFAEFSADGKRPVVSWNGRTWTVYNDAGKPWFEFESRSGALYEYREWFAADGVEMLATVRASSGELTEIETGPAARRRDGKTVKLGREVYTGTRTELDEKERPKTTKSWLEGLPHGEQVTWSYDADGRILDRRADIYERGKRTGSTTHQVRWSHDGKKLSENNWKDGSMHGPTTSWYKNGRKRVESNWVDGRQVGESRSWHENGKPASVETYDERGELHGASSHWNELGQLTSQRNRLHGKLNGEWIDLRYEEGKLVSKRVRVFENNKMVSDQTTEAPAR